MNVGTAVALVEGDQAKHLPENESLELSLHSIAWRYETELMGDYGSPAGIGTDSGLDLAFRREGQGHATLWNLQTAYDYERFWLPRVTGVQQIPAKSDQEVIEYLKRIASWYWEYERLSRIPSDSPHHIHAYIDMRNMRDRRGIDVANRKFAHEIRQQKPTRPQADAELLTRAVSDTDIEYIPNSCDLMRPCDAQTFMAALGGDSVFSALSKGTVAYQYVPKPSVVGY